MTTKINAIARSALICTACLIGCSVFLLPTAVGASDQLKNSEIIQKLVPVTGDTQRAIDLAIGFEINSAILTERARLQLNELALALQSKELAEVTFEIYGHTDKSGTAELNMKLSKSRAEAVVNYLTDHHQISPERFLKIEGFGDTKLIPGLNEKSPQHRRVEVVALYQEVEKDNQKGQSKNPVAIN